MKILHLSSEKSWRGGEQQIAYLVEEQIKAGINVTVLCRKESEFEKYCKKNNIQFVTLGFNNNFDLVTAYAIRKYQKRNSFDIIHVHSSRSHSLTTIAASMGMRANIVLSRRVDFQSSGNLLSNYKYNHKQIRKIICVSEKVKEIIGRTVKDKTKLCVVHDGIDLKRFENTNRASILHSNYNLTANTKIIANISALADHKDYPTFIKTAEYYLRNYSHEAKFLIIGSGALYESLLQEVEAKGLMNDIIFTGFRDDIPLIFKEIDVFLMTSKEEGLGSTVLDAFANQIPVVATAAGGIPEMVQNDQTGILCEVGDYKSLAEGIWKLFNDSQLCERLTNNAYSKLIDEFTKERTASRTLEVYNDILCETKS
ncbi:MAG: glycosyltransferase family 4 protein [Flavobacteriales bacterium]|nr:glycosyltransferase family 4 protein [Flavobacteriales bacterium]MCB9198488.1 glycosyltransferase family 4 protein [Flavobacteriales bacterium]